MRKTLLLIVFVIILVAVSWFKTAYCQTVDKHILLQQFEQSGKITGLADSTYTSPGIYEQVPEAKMPEPELETDRPDAAQKKDHAELEPFGYDLFRSPSESSLPSDVADLSDYVLGPGDNIIVYLWGKVEKEYNLTVDRQGRIFIPRVGEIIVWGLTLENFESETIKRLSKVYTDFNASVSLGKIRSIRIYLTGEVKNPGAYTVSSLTTLFNALYLAGGPNHRGSMRNIQLLRNNRLEKRLDLYDFLLKGDTQSDIRLSSGDVIFIPVSGPRISITGQIKRPAIYELLGGERVTDLLELAGGPTAAAYLDRIMMDRISPEDQREVYDLNLNPGNDEIDDIELLDGDILSVFSIYDMRRNVVAVAGMVKHPGYFERNDSTTLRTLITQSELQPENVYYERANIFRRYADQRVEIIPVNLHDVLENKIDIPLHDQDSLHIYSVDEIRPKDYVHIDGEIRNPGSYSYFESMTIYDLIFLAGNLKKNAYRKSVELARTDSLGRVHLRYFDLTLPEQAAAPLQEEDRVFVRKIPDWFENRLVTVDGAVRFPGTYALHANTETLYDILNRAGWFTETAFPKGTIVKRNKISRELERQNLPQMVSNSQPFKEDSTGNIKKLELLHFEPENLNRIIIDMDKIIATAGKGGDITLESGDYIYVPDFPSGVSVMGAVGANGTIRFESGKNVKYYIKRAGNFTNQADRKHSRLIKADGRVFAGNGVLGKKVELGDAIVVPTQIKKDHDWLKTISSTVSIIGGLATTVFIIDKL